MQPAALCAAAMVAVLGIAPGARALAGEKWLPVKDVSLEIVPGSALDFSALVEPGPAGRHGALEVASGGHFVFQAQPAKPRRFMCASMYWSPATGGYPDRATADRYARQLRLHGYNLARLHFVEATLMTGRVGDFDYDPAELDRFFYFLAALKREGIYWVIDMMASENGAAGAVFPHRWIEKHDMTLRVYFDPAVQAHWRRLVETLYGRVNPYTGRTTLGDPALAGAILVNENTLNFIARRNFPAALKQPFARWLRSRYGDEARLAKAWGPLGRGESLDKAAIEFPPLYEISPRMRDVQAFFVDLQRDAGTWMTAHLRKLGYKGPTSSYDNVPLLSTDLARSTFDWVDMHAYHDHADAITPPARMTNTSSLENNLGYVQELAWARQAGRAYSVTEYGQPFWNQWRREQGIAVPAYAALHDWGYACVHGQGAIELTYAGHASPRRQAIIPYNIGHDPVARAGETLAALIFGRADVAVAPRRVRVVVREQDAVDAMAYRMLPRELMVMSLVTRTELAFDRDKAARRAMASALEFDFTAPTSPQLARVWDKARARLGFPVSFGDYRQALVKDGIIGNGNRTEPERGIFHSITGEILVDAPQRRFTVVTPRTEAVSMKAGAHKLDRLDVKSLSTDALVALSALDGGSLKDASRMLLIVATDALNSDMRFEGGDRRSLEKLGRFPVLLRDAALSVEIEHAAAQALEAYALDLRGERVQKLATTAREGVLGLAFTLSHLERPTTFFEIVRKK